MSPRNAFEDNRPPCPTCGTVCGGPPCENGNVNFNRTPEEVAQGEDSPPSEIPKENLGGLFEAEDAAIEMIKAIKAGEVDINDARKFLGLPPITEEMEEILATLQGNSGKTFESLRDQHLEARRDPTRWERG